MPNLAKGRSGFALVELLIMLAVLAVFWWFVVKPIGKLTRDSDKYLGTNSNPATLVGNIEENNAFHREQYGAIGCSIFKLENPGKPCPKDGPTSRPTSPPPRP